VPKYRDLPPARLGGRSAWGVFGERDEVGTLGRITPNHVAAAARLVRDGRVFPLDARWGTFDPPLYPIRTTARHTVLHREGTLSFDDVWDNVHPQGGSQWDALAHVGYTADEYYNGVSAHEVINDGRNSIGAWGERGIVARGVLLDVPRAFAAAGKEWDPAGSSALGVDELELTRRASGVEVGEGDILVIHTGFAEQYAARTMQQRAVSARPGTSPTTRRSASTSGTSGSPPSCPTPSRSKCGRLTPRTLRHRTTSSTGC
jgi:hypothetical protein